MYVYACIILYVCICAYNSEYVRICMYMRICTYIFSKGLYTLKMDVDITAILAQWQRSSPFTVETGVRDLKTCSRPENEQGVLHLFKIKFQERPTSHVL